MQTEIQTYTHTRTGTWYSYSMHGDYACVLFASLNWCKYFVYQFGKWFIRWMQKCKCDLLHTFTIWSTLPLAWIKIRYDRNTAVAIAVEAEQKKKWKVYALHNFKQQVAVFLLIVIVTYAFLLCVCVCESHAKNSTWKSVAPSKDFGLVDFCCCWLFDLMR